MVPDPTAAVLLTKDTAHAPMDRGVAARDTAPPSPVGSSPGPGAVPCTRLTRKEMKGGGGQVERGWGRVRVLKRGLILEGRRLLRVVQGRGCGGRGCGGRGRGVVVVPSLGWRGRRWARLR